MSIKLKNVANASLHFTAQTLAAYLIMLGATKVFDSITTVVTKKVKEMKERKAA